jgi:hypothetical protein
MKTEMKPNEKQEISLLPLANHIGNQQRISLYLSILSSLEDRFKH